MASGRQALTVKVFGLRDIRGLEFVDLCSTSTTFKLEAMHSTGNLEGKTNLTRSDRSDARK